MNLNETRQAVGLLLRDLAEELDVPPSKYQEAKERYDAVGAWLNAKESVLARYSPDIHPQGSFALGTVTRPVGEEEYDVDAVCRLNVTPSGITQQQLKDMVGNRLKQNAKYVAMLDPKEGGRRCWTLQYAEETKFHLDILPAIPDVPNWLVGLGVPHELARHAICITDKKTWDYAKDWPRSNPKGYAEWFKSRMTVVLNERRRALAAERQARVEDINDYEVRTPLQRVVQLLKRHRDIRYNGDDDKPISIIITTLAAQAYQNEPAVENALINVVPRMRHLIVKRNGVWWIPNPVNPAESFADKWAETPRKADVFFEWHDRLEME
ncbi:MAG: nucleotidyltransferase, partial [Verrucomicrobiia bacterium]